MNKKITLINVHSSCNAGDEALTQVAIDQLREQFPESLVTLIMNDPTSHRGDEQTVLSFLSWINHPGGRPVVRFAWLVFLCLIPLITLRFFHNALYLPFSKDIQKSIKTLIDSDMIVGTPGGYFYSYGKGRAFIYLSFTMAVAVLAGKPLYLLPQSYGPLQFARERALARWLLTRARVIMAREPVSLKFLESMGVENPNTYVLPDMAFAFKGTSPASGADWLIGRRINPHTDRPLLGMTVIDWGAQYRGFSNQEKYEEVMAAAIRHFVNEYNGKVFLFPQSWGPTPAEDDRIPSKRVADRVPELKSSIIFVDEPLAAGLLKSIYGHADIFIGTRMHSNIFAMTGYVPLIAIGYLHKTIGIARMAGIEKWVANIREIDKQDLNQILDQLWINRDNVHSQLEKMIPRLAEETKQAGSIIAQDFEIYSKGKSHA